ncbi:MAG: hypothetical protein KatS3mg104_1177 [Phycisphaerae bacterium]|jgi:hypothetical protein|nr:MAG: hypothetical protein KatS3mg104_1177 [Phycisphaerae bacterium]
MAAIWEPEKQKLLRADIPVVDLVGGIPSAPLVHTMTSQ